MLENKLIELKKNIISEATLAEKMIAYSIQGLIELDREILYMVIEEDEIRLNAIEIEIDEMCVNITALFSPEAKDLRSVLMIMKMNNDLERIGDLAVNISHSAIHIIKKGFMKIDMGNIPELSNLVKKMLANTINAFINENVELARIVLKTDKAVDEMRRSNIKKLVRKMGQQPDKVDILLKLNNITNYLERIADLSTNIAEETIYLAEGHDVKHGFK